MLRPWHYVLPSLPCLHGRGYVAPRRPISKIIRSRYGILLGWGPVVNPNSNPRRGRVDRSALSTIVAHRAGDPVPQIAYFSLAPRDRKRLTIGGCCGWRAIDITLCQLVRLRVCPSVRPSVCLSSVCGSAVIVLAAVRVRSSHQPGKHASHVPV